MAKCLSFIFVSQILCSWQLTTSFGGKQTFESFEVIDIQFTLRQWWEYLTLRKIITFGFIKRVDKGQISTVNDLES